MLSFFISLPPPQYPKMQDWTLAFIALLTYHSFIVYCESSHYYDLLNDSDLNRSHTFTVLCTILHLFMDAEMRQMQLEMLLLQG